MDETAKHIPLHEKWKDYTAEEVVNIQKEQCTDCKYFKQWIHTKGYVNSGYCDYISCTGESRNCSPDGCTKKVVGPPNETVRRICTLKMPIYKEVLYFNEEIQL